MKFKHDPKLARTVFNLYASEAGRANSEHAYELWLDHYVKPMLRLLAKRGVVEEIEGIKL